MIGRILRAPLVRLLIVVIVPAVVLGVFVAALAAADSGDARIPAALVNNDQLVQSKGADGKTTTVAAGRLVVSGLTKPTGGDAGASIDWTLTNTKDAKRMLADGDVYAIVTIPKDFSKSISTVSSATPKQAEISVRTDDAHGTLVSQIGGIVGTTIASSVGGQITTSVVSGLYGGYATVRSSLLQAADGATSLGDGASKLSSGLSQAADGGDQLSTGAGSLGDGARQLASGQRSLASGLGTAASGAQGAAAGAERLASGVDQYTDGVSTYTGKVSEYAAGVTTFANGAADFGTGASTYADGATQALGAIISGAQTSADAQSQLASSSSAAADGIRAVLQDPTISASSRDALTRIADGLTTSSTAQAALAAGSRQTATSDQLAALRDAGPGLVSGGTALAKGAKPLADAGPAISAGGKQLASGGASLDSGTAALATGLGKLPGGISSAAAGAGKIASGIDQLGTGADKLSTGASQLTDGVRKSADGAGQLATGADKIGSGLKSGAGQVPNLTKAQQTAAGKVVASPVDSSASRANELSGPGQIVSTLIVPVGLWIGAAALVLLFGAVSRRLLATGVGTGRLVGGALLRGVVVAVAQAVLIVVVVASTLGVSWAALPVLFLVAVVAGIAFLAIHQLLQALFGSAGTVLSIVLLGVQLVAVGGIYPIQLVSAPFQTISPFLPLTAAVNATTAVLTGADGGTVATGLLSLALWAVLAFVLTVSVVARRRSSPTLFTATPALS